MVAGRKKCYGIAAGFAQKTSVACMEGSENMEPQTNAELNVLLEVLAKLVEQTAVSAEDAARIIREAKV